MRYYVYSLYHFRKERKTVKDIKHIGFFSNISNCNKAITYLQDKPGFKDYLNGFKWVEIIIDEIYWKDGFNEFIGPFHDFVADFKMDNKDNNKIPFPNSDVYFLEHFFQTGPDLYDEDVRIIGVFSTHEKMNKVENELRTKKGFSKYPDEFCGEKYTINEIEWREGFG